jgi:hypothetical protein
MERERKRRQLKTAGGENKTSFIQMTKLSMMNSGLISLKKGEAGADRLNSDFLDTLRSPAGLAMFSGLDTETWSRRAATRGPHLTSETECCPLSVCVLCGVSNIGNIR